MLTPLSLSLTVPHPRPNSRTLRRQTSPSLTSNLDRSLKDLPRPPSPSPTRPQPTTTTKILVPNTSSRITKSTSKAPKRGKHSRAQRLRAEKLKEKALRNRDVLEGKVSGSWERGRRVRERKSERGEGESIDPRDGEGGGEGGDEEMVGEEEEARVKRRKGKGEGDRRPLEEKMVVVELVEAQDALGGLEVSGEGELEREGKGEGGGYGTEGVKEAYSGLNGGGAAENVEMVTVTPPVTTTTTTTPKSVPEVTSILPTTEPDDDTNGIT